MTGIAAHFWHWVERAPERLFIAEDNRSYSYRRFGHLVSALAARLTAEGISHGDRVVLYLDSKPLHVASYLATLTNGAIAVHLYPEHPRSHVAFAASHTGAGLVITRDKDLSVPDRRILVLPDELEDSREAPPPLRPHPIAYLMFTSGTTAKPKAVITTQKNLMFVTRTLIDLAAMKAGDRELIFMPLGSTGGSGHLHAAITLGNTVELLPWFIADIHDRELEIMLDILERKQITGFLGTPRIVQALLDRHREAFARKGRRLRYLLANVTPMKQETVRTLLQLLPNLRFCTYYGLTEASRSILNVCRENPGYEHAAGFPAPSVEVKIAPLAGTGESGEICIRGANVTPGYWDSEPGATDPEGWFRTGDLGYLDKTGRVYVTGRIKETINIDGLKCIPNEIESVVNEAEEVAACAVVAIPDHECYQRIGVAVTLKEQAANETKKNRLARRVIAACGRRLSSYKVPACIYILEHLPQTDLGKVKRLELAELLATSTQGYPKP